MRVVLTGPVAAAFPETEIRLVAAHGLRNDRPWPGLQARLVELERRVAAGEWAPADDSRPEIASWHAAFRRFGTNPRRVRPSVDALGRRLVRTGRLPRVSPTVDAYNLVSVTHAVPVGAFDQRGLGAEVLVRYAEPGDAFTPLGEPETVERPGAGEVVYADGGGRVLTRHWNHRDADATKVTPASRDVLFVLERVSAVAVPAGQLARAQAALAELLRPHAADVELATVRPDQPAADCRPAAAAPDG